MVEKFENIVVNMKKAIRIKNLLQFHEPGRKFLSDASLLHSTKALNNVVANADQSCWHVFIDSMFQSYDNEYEVVLYILALNKPEVSKYALMKLKSVVSRSNPTVLCDKMKCLSLMLSYNAPIDICDLVAEIYELLTVMPIISWQLMNYVRSKQFAAFKWLLLLSCEEKIKFQDLQEFLSKKQNQNALCLSTIERSTFLKIENYLFGCISDYCLQCYENPVPEKNKPYQETLNFYLESLSLYFDKFTDLSDTNEKVKYYCWKLEVRHEIMEEDLVGVCSEVCQLNDTVCCKEILLFLIMMGKVNYAASLSRMFPLLRKHWPLSKYVFDSNNCGKSQSATIAAGQNPLTRNATESTCVSCNVFLEALKKIPNPNICCLKTYTTLFGTGKTSIISLYIHPHYYLVDMLEREEAEKIKDVLTALTKFTVITGFNVRDDIERLQMEFLQVEDCLSLEKFPIYELSDKKLVEFECINDTLKEYDIEPLQRNSNFLGLTRRPLPVETYTVLAQEIYASYLLYLKMSGDEDYFDFSDDDAVSIQTFITAPEHNCMHMNLPSFVQGYYTIYIDEMIRGVGTILLDEGGVVSFVSGDWDTVLSTVKCERAVLLTRRRQHILDKADIYYLNFADRNYLNANQMADVVKNNDFLWKVIFEIYVNLPPNPDPRCTIYVDEMLIGLGNKLSLEGGKVSFLNGDLETVLEQVRNENAVLLTRRRQDIMEKANIFYMNFYCTHRKCYNSDEMAIVVMNNDFLNRAIFVIPIHFNQENINLPRYKRSYYTVFIDTMMYGLGKELAAEGGNVTFLRGCWNEILDEVEYDDAVLLTRRRHEFMEDANIYYVNFCPTDGSCYTLDEMVAIVKNNYFLRKVIFDD